MARKPKSTAGAAAAQGQTAGGAVTREQLDAARRDPNINTAVTTLQPFANGVLGIVQSLTVTNETERHVMADLLRQIKTAMANVDEKFDPITKPLWAAWKAAQTWRNEVKGPLEQAEALGKEKLGDWELAQLAEASRRTRAEQMREKEQRERERAVNTAPVPGVDFPHSVAPNPNYPVMANPVPQTISPIPTVPLWESATKLTPPTPAPLAGISSRAQWTVEVEDETTATRALISSGLWDLQMLGVVPLLVRLDVSAMKIAVRGEDEVAQTVREVLGQIPGLKVVQTAVTTVRGYE